MQVIYKIDKIFVVIYSTIIVLVGLFFTLLAKNLLLIPITLLVLAGYLYFALKRPLRRWKAVRNPFPQQWREYLNRVSRFYRLLNKDRKRHFERDVQIFLSDFPIRGIQNREIDPFLKLTIAAGIAVVLHGRLNWEPPTRDGVLVYPSERFNEDYELGKGDFAGEAPRNGPMIIAEGSLIFGLEHPGSGYNVIYHELAHYFDWEDGQAGGLPINRLPSSVIPYWKEIIHSEWQKAMEGNSVLRPYAGKNEAELFAVATEAFFETPLLLQKHHPELYELLRDFYNVDTVELISSS